MIEILAVVIPVVILLITLGWPHIKKYVPFFPRPLLRISYQKQNNSAIKCDALITILIENIGNAPAIYFTMDISGQNGVFSIKRVQGDFDISTSGQGGSWTIVSGKNILPQQKGYVNLAVDNINLNLEKPKVKSDSRHKFAGTVVITVGQEETYEEYKKKNL